MFFNEYPTSQGSGGKSSKNLEMGYYEFDNGLIMQWGYVSATAPGAFRVTYPKPFPHMTSSVVCSTIRSFSGDRGYNHVWNISRTGFTALLDAHPAAGSKGGYWFAIGY